MKTAGIDIGSRTVKLVLVEDGEVVLSRCQINSFDPLAVCKDLLGDVSYDTVVATGYGRHLFKERYECNVISEIKAVKMGARALFPRCRTILDIGGQDTKVVSLDEAGRILKFEMNDKCAAGTGRFLEIMAMALGYSLVDFGQAAAVSEDAAKINSMCTVFAESEVISMVGRGLPRAAVARGIHQAVVRGSVAMLRQIEAQDDFVFVGGVALNGCIRSLLKATLGREVLVPEAPRVVGALGCALQASL